MPEESRKRGFSLLLQRPTLKKASIIRRLDAKGCVAPNVPGLFASGQLLPPLSVKLPFILLPAPPPSSSLRSCAAVAEVRGGDEEVFDLGWLEVVG